MNGLHVALYQPEIPPNTGNVIRLCANTGTQLHLIHPLGFDVDDRALKRAGLDYHVFATVHQHASLADLHTALPAARVLVFSTRGRTRYDHVRYQPGDLLLFGPETRGLPAEVIDSVPESQRIFLPMQPDNRSVNLSNSVAVTVYEAWRQMGFPGAAER